MTRAWVGVGFLACAAALVAAAPSDAAEIPRLTLEAEATQYPTEFLAAAEDGTAIVELAIAVDGSVSEAGRPARCWLYAASIQ